jgi:hypothetical protein
MLPEGIRYASTMNARNRRKIARAPAIDLKFSQTVLSGERRETGRAF